MICHQLPPPPPPEPPPPTPLPLGAENIADERFDVIDAIEYEKCEGIKVLNPPGETYQLGGSW